ncbi:hypothetical protein [Sphingomonas crocodyli]|uniref:Uncharacterized protein n=1 Tax=Sphingomonas crocodyli TaxID=1979270 RepID=A0A437LYG7_9SPHN|nr:hypothetical protein [Sphingomonas crocodyli]RVT90479.1 hypothetical protein EOD43_19710 [Sphingomonas crocodyli]
MSATFASEVAASLGPFLFGAWMLLTMIRNRKAVRQREADAARLAGSAPVEITKRKAMGG